MLEAGKFDMAFFDDRLAMPDRYGDDFVESVRNGVRVVKMDLIPLMTAMGLASERLGIGGTYSTTYYQPFHVARTFATLDHMLGGRVAWNVVTSLNDSEAANFGQVSHLEHDLRYDLADEFMEAVLGHWDTWEDDAIVFDKEHDVFADPSKVHRLDYEGRWIRSRGPFTVPRTPQGRPVIIQAGQSGRGRRFAARWAELMFVIFPNKEYGQREYREVKAAIAETRPRSRPGQAAAGGVLHHRRDAHHRRGEARLHRAALSPDRRSGAALRGAELRFCRQGAGRGLVGRGARLDQWAARSTRSDHAHLRQEQPHDA